MHRRFSLITFCAAVLAVSALFSSQLYAEEYDTVIFGAYHNPPKMTVENNEIGGFWAELINHIAELEKWKITYSADSWQNNLEKLKNGRIDAMPDVAFTAARAQLYNFLDIPVLASWSRVYVGQNNTDINSLEDLKGKRIGGLSGSVNIEGPDGIKRLVQSFNLQVRIIEMNSYKEVLEALEAGFVDAAITNRNFGDEYAKTHPVKQTPIMFQPVSLTFAFPKNSEKSAYLMRRLSFQMKSLMNDNNSVYYRLMTKYFSGSLTEKEVEVLPRWFKWAFLSVSAFIIFLGSIVLVSRVQVHRKTRQLQELNKNLQKSIEAETAKRMKNEQIMFSQKKFIDMGQMMSAISHQWRQPLNNIILISDWLEERWEMGDDFTPEHKRSFHKQSEVIQRMSETIDEFKSFFKPDNDICTFNIVSTYIDCLHLLKQEMQNHKISMSMKCVCKDGECFSGANGPDLKCKSSEMLISGYPGEFKQVILNLLGNARDAVVENQSGDRKIFTEFSIENDSINISIKDNGGGIREDLLDNVFEPYFTTKDEGKGIGMGLYMSRIIVESHMGGEIHLENNDGGLTVHMKLQKGKTTVQDFSKF